MTGMKRHSAWGLSIFAMALISVGLFQNCGGNQLLFGNQSGASAPTDDNQTYSGIKGQVFSRASLSGCADGMTAETEIVIESAQTILITRENCKNLIPRRREIITNLVIDFTNLTQVVYNGITLLAAQFVQEFSCDGVETNVALDRTVKASFDFRRHTQTGETRAAAQVITSLGGVVTQSVTSGFIDAIATCSGGSCAYQALSPARDFGFDLIGAGMNQDGSISTRMDYLQGDHLIIDGYFIAPSVDTVAYSAIPNIPILRCVH